jgi:hypothetical protein
MTQQRIDLETRIEQFKKRQEDIEALQFEDGQQVAPETLRQLRQQLHHAGIELAMLERDTRCNPEAATGLGHLSFGELTRIGLGILWPLIVGLLLAAGIVAAGLIAVFGL